MIRLIAILALFPALHAGQPFALDDWWKWRDVIEARISPDGARVVWVEGFRHRAADREGSNLWTARGRITEGLWHDTSPRFSPDGERIAFLSDRGGSAQIWMADRQVTHSDTPVLALAWSPDGAWFAYTAAVAAPKPAWAPPELLPFLRGAPTRIGLFVIAASGGSARAAGDLPIEGEPAWMPDGKSIAVASAGDIYLAPVAGGTPRRITPDSATAYNPVPSPDGSRIAWIGRDRKPQSYTTAKLRVANPDGSRARVLAGALDRDVTRPQWSSDSRTVYFLSEDHGESHIWAARADGNVRQVTSARERLLEFALADNGRAVAVRAPGEVITFPVDVKDTPSGIAAPNAPLLAERDAGASEAIEFPSDGKTIQGWIVKPPGFDAARKYPLLIDVQDAPRRMCGVEFRLRAQIFAARGFLVLCANPRGTPGYGEEFGNLLATRNPGDDFDDLMRGVDYLIGRGFIDSGRLHIAGGLLAVWAIGHTDRFRSAVVTDPPAAPPGSAPWDDPQRYIQHLPLTFAASFKTPTLVIDTGISSGGGDLYSALRSRGVEAAWVSLPQSRRPSHDVMVMEAAMRWWPR